MTELNLSNIKNTIEDIAEYRLNICYKCPIYSTRMGGLCNNKLWLDPKTNDVSTSKKSGYIRGCGCLLKSKVKNPDSSCIADKW